MVYNLNNEYDSNINRKLTNSEKNNILSVIIGNHSIPPETKHSVETIIKSNLLKQLDNIYITNENIIHKLKDNIEYYYNTSQIQPGESVGIITGESIGERQTQMTLNTFHSAGLAISTVLTGVPRFSELLNATKDPKSVLCNIYMKDNGLSIDEIRKKISNQIRNICLG